MFNYKIIIFFTFLIAHLFIAKLKGEETTENPPTENYLLNYNELSTNSPLEEEAETRSSRSKRLAPELYDRLAKKGYFIHFRR